MRMAGSWYTKEDILQDLQEVSPGRRVADMDDNGLVYANRRPPRLLAYENEQTELELLYGRDAADILAQGDPVHQAVPAPDLLGITQMRRMVQNYEHSSDDDLISSSGKKIVITKPIHSYNKVTKNQPPKNVKVECSGLTVNLNDGSKIIKRKVGSNSEKQNIIQSKLNPNVKEFVPKILQKFPSTSSSVNNSSSTNLGVSLASTNDKSDKISKFHDLERLQDTADTKTHKDKEESINDEKKEAALLIKSQISTKNNTLEQQQKTNISIVKLLKLYAEPKPKNTIKLLTPEYFEKSIGEGSKNEVKSNKKRSIPKSDGKHCDKVQTFTGVERMASLHDIVEDNSSKTLASHSPENASYCTDVIHQDSSIHGELKQHTTNKDKVEKSTELTPTLADWDIQGATPITESSQEVDHVDPYIKESIVKVNNWLNEKPVASVATVNKEKSALIPVLNANAVSFKRKESSTCKSPCEVTKKVPKPAVAEYRPSSYAQELHKKYSERSNATSPVPVLNIWEKLEADLKKKDAEILNRTKKA